LAVLALFPFHAGQIFTEAAFYVRDQITSPMIIGISDFIYQWRMPLFMFLAGNETQIIMCGYAQIDAFP
jgi:peptidoglycan biosynthesis protein MviN/MurJ (putative lipid II flippase)